MPELRNVPQSAIELADVGLAELDAQGNFVSANPAFAAMLGERGRDLRGRNWRATVHPDDHARAAEAYRAAETRGHGYAEVRAWRDDRATVHQALNITALRDERGALSGYYCLRHNISAYKRDQEVLTLAVESAPSGLIILDARGRIGSVNRAVEKLFGYTREELAGREVEHLLPERFRARHVAHRGRGNSSERMGGRDLIGLRKDGVEIPLEIFLNRIDTGAGELTLCTVIDIAERVRSEQQLQLATQAAEAASRAKSDFLARMSHEIRTPMNLINGMNALLLESPLDEKQRRHVEISHRNVRRLLRLINGILDLSKVEAGKVTLEAAPFDLQQVVAECAATTSSAIEQKGLQFTAIISPAAGRYWIGDAERLQQVLLNLIGNAVKFTAAGKIELRVYAETGQPGAGGLRFEVADTGCGIARNQQATIFEAFQQAEGSTDHINEGTGLGLAIARTLVEMMGGRIWIEDRPGPGSKFVFTALLPRATEEMARAAKLAAASGTEEGSVQAGTKILVVEDNAENLILLRAYLDNLSLSLDFASNGIEALEKRKSGGYDLILMDIQMPLMDGHTATREIRAWEKSHNAPRVPIVALTAHALTGASAESMEAGCQGHLTKPIERGELIAAIAKFAERPVKSFPAVPAPIAARRPAFLENRWKDLAKMRDALAAGDLAAVQNIGHNCKGIGAGYGFPDITEIGSAIEKAAKANDLTSLRESLREFEVHIQAAGKG